MHNTTLIFHFGALLAWAVMFYGSLHAHNEANVSAFWNKVDQITDRPAYFWTMLALSPLPAALNYDNGVVTTAGAYLGGLVRNEWVFTGAFLFSLWLTMLMAATVFFLGSSAFILFDAIKRIQRMPSVHTYKTYLLFRATK